MITQPTTPRGPTNVDRHVGARIRLRRCQLDMSQSFLGDQLGVTFQQVQKYEAGTNRVGASRLYNLAAVLEVPVQFFFDGLDNVAFMAAKDELFDFIASPDGIALSRAFSGIKDTAQRRSLIDLMRTMAGETVSDGEAAKLYDRAQKGRVAA